MKRRLSTLLICTVLFTACATTAPPANNAPKEKPKNIKEWIGQNRSHHGAAAGAALGFLGGAGLALLQGKKIDDVLADAVVGATIGAIAGYAIGKHQDRIFAGRDLAIRYARYDASQGYVARIEAVSFDPPNPKPGQTAKLSVRYIVLGPIANEELKIRMFRGLKYGDDYIFGVGPDEFAVPKGGGIVGSTVELTLSKKATVGTYSGEALLEDTKGRFPQVIGNGSLYVVENAHTRGGAATAAR